MLPDERETRLGDCAPNHALLFGGRDAVTVRIDPETAFLPLCKGEVIAVAVKGIPFDEHAFQAVLALGCAGYECFYDLFVGHGIVCWCWLRDQSRLVFKINRCRDFLHAADEGFVGFLDAVRRNIHRTGSLVGVIPLADVCVLIHDEDILG